MGEVQECLTNLMEVSGKTVAQLYKNRWIIEMLFKQLKQNFELKYFLSDTEYRIMSQIWVALIVNLIFTLIERMIKKAEDFSTLVSVAAKNLCFCISFIQFITSPELYESRWKYYEEDLGKCN